MPSRKIAYKRDSIMLYFPGEKEKESKILMDKVDFYTSVN